MAGAAVSGPGDAGPEKNEESDVQRYEGMRTLEAEPGRVWTAWRSEASGSPRTRTWWRCRTGGCWRSTRTPNQHWADGDIRLTLIQSADKGATWALAGILAKSDRSKRGHRTG